MKGLSLLALGTTCSISLSVVAAVQPGAAAIINGGFETANFTGWTTIGNTSIETEAFGSGPTEGTFQALLMTSSIEDFGLETFLGLEQGSLDSLGNGDATEGSAIKQTFTANAGQVLTFDWNFFTDELTFDNNPFSFNDFAFVSLTSLNELADTSLIFMTSATEFDDETGFKRFSFVIPETGTYTLGIGVTDVGNRVFESGLLIDNVAVTAVTPEPASTLGLFALGAFAASSTLFRKRQQKE